MSQRREREMSLYKEWLEKIREVNEDEKTHYDRDRSM